MWRRLLGPLVGLGLLALLLRGTLLAPERIPVRSVRVAQGVVESTITNTKAGTVRARLRAQLSSEAGGRVEEILHREGEQVKQGEVLVRMGDTTQRARLLLAQESLRAAEASRRQTCVSRDRARRELERKRGLAEKEIVSADLLDQLESRYQGTRAACNAAGAQADRARAEIALAEAELEKMAIRAPFDGLVAEVEIEVGEWITPSLPLVQAPSVIDLLDPSSLYVSAPMDEVDSAAIRPGQHAKVTVDSWPGREFAGQVVRVAPYVLDLEAQNRTVEIEVELEDRGIASRLLPGTSADVEVVLEVREAVLRIPTSSLLEGDQVLVASDGRLHQQPVEIGLKNWDWAEVRQGLEAGQLVVVSLDREEVKDGARVTVEETEYAP